ncbi:MAG: tRNA preQ1(34) S-adenosylmethionine ribosyltransferase-isomerase QueA [Geminicoccaceae bacterium]|nr:tRNA preQ1(34) S-adenosylmethionine ribosyltransferase-isomerase QueA [Geminicoccaceae bacterium]
MRVDQFDFALPADLIAQRPVRPREAARLLHVGAGLTDLRVADLPSLFRAGDLMVLNDTRVLPTRFAARRGNAAVEVTLVQPIGEAAWWAFARPGKRLRAGDPVTLAEGLEARVVEKDEAGRIRLDFTDLAGGALIERIKARGAMPLPPYVKRPEGGDAADHEAYQTVFARRDGAVASPTASLHLSETMLDTLRERGVETVFVTLHVGLGTFLPVKVEDTADHVMHEEWFEIEEAAAARLDRARAEGRRVTAVGTTALRALESAAGPNGMRPGAATTGLFVKPGYRFRVVDRLMTNFHLPRSTLFMLVAAFAGLERMRRAYAHAVAERYRFFSYGDASMLERAP